MNSKFFIQKLYRAFTQNFIYHKNGSNVK